MFRNCALYFLNTKNLDPKYFFSLNQGDFPEFGDDKQDNLYILSPPDCARVETLQELQMEIESVTFYLDCKVGGHPRNCKPNRVEVRVNVL